MSSWLLTDRVKHIGAQVSMIVIHLHGQVILRLVRKCRLVLIHNTSDLIHKIISSQRSVVLILLGQFSLLLNKHIRFESSSSSLSNLLNLETRVRPLVSVKSLSRVLINSSSVQVHLSRFFPHSIRKVLFHQRHVCALLHLVV